MDSIRVDELYSLFRRCLPGAVRAEDTARAILADEQNTVLERRDAEGALVAASVMHGDVIYMLCVDEHMRGRGIGSELLAESENVMRGRGFDSVRVGAGDEYLVPGVPVRTPPHDEALPLRLDAWLNDDARRFFEKRGYVHDWGECNCFDMRMELKELPCDAPAVGEERAGILCRWAREEDMPAACACTDDAEPSFTRYYADKTLYVPGNPSRALVAECEGGVRGVLIVSRETEGKGLGSVGCTAVANAWQGRGIASRMVLTGTRSLRDSGLEQGFLGYTYSGLERLYGRSGYRVSALYFMARKALERND